MQIFSILFQFMDIPTPKGIVQFDIETFGKPDLDYNSKKRVATCSVISKQKGGKLILKDFTINKYNFFYNEPFKSLTEQLKSLGYSVSDNLLKYIRTSHDETFTYIFEEEDFYINIKVCYR